MDTDQSTIPALIQQEIWLPVPGFDDEYEASNLGSIRSKDGELLRFKPGSAGHLSVTLRKNKVSTLTTVHKIVALTFFGPRPDGHEVDHVDCNKTNNRIGNLEYVTPQENQRRSQANSLSLKGKLRLKEILTEEAMRDIKRRLENNETRASIAELYGITAQNVADFPTAKQWRHIFAEDGWRFYRRTP